MHQRLNQRLNRWQRTNRRLVPHRWCWRRLNRRPWVPRWQPVNPRVDSPQPSRTHKSIIIIDRGINASQTLDQIPNQTSRTRQNKKHDNANHTPPRPEIAGSGPRHGRTKSSRRHSWWCKSRRNPGRRHRKSGRRKTESPIPIAVVQPPAPTPALPFLVSPSSSSAVPDSVPPARQLRLGGLVRLAAAAVRIR